MQNTLRNLILTALFSMACVFADEDIISQIADGQGWQSVLVVTNTTASPTTALISFFKDSGNGNTGTWTPDFVESTDLSPLSLPAGSSVFLHTRGTATALTQGWAQIEGGSGVDAYVIYTYSAAGAPKQDATAPALSPATRFLLPFDNTTGLVTTMAFVNPNQSPLTISANFKTASGATSTGSIPNIPANGHMAFVMPSQFSGTAGQSGLAEFYSNGGSFSMIALRAHSPGPLSFTSVPVFGESGPPIISTSGGGGGGGGVPSGDITFASFGIGKQTSARGTTEVVGGQISAYTPTAWNLPFNGTKIDKCIVYDITYDPTSTYPSAPELALDAGQITLTGPGLPGGSVVVTKTTSSIGPIYSTTLANNPLVGGGTYNLAAAGGTQVEAFNTSASLPDNFTSNVSTTTSINRSSALPINWTGTGFENVIINVVAAAIDLPSIHAVTITCVVPASQHSYSVPTAALSKLPAVSAGSLVPASLTIATAPAFSGTVTAQGATTTTLTPNLVGGGKVKYGGFAPYFTIISTLTSIQ